VSAAQWLFANSPTAVRWHAIARIHRIHEPEIGRINELLPAGGVAMDIGAWWGPWTYWLSRRASEVITIEPLPHLVEFIRKAAPHNVRVIAAAASDREGTAALWAPTTGLGSEGRATMHPIDGAHTGMKTVDVPTITVDSIGLTKLDLLKIDVEGHEPQALAGAVATIQHCRPTLVVEIEQRFHDQPIATIFRDIEAMGYDGSFLKTDRWHPLSEFNPDTMQATQAEDVTNRRYSIRQGPGQYINNFVFKPRS
jgi:FkbM family methyltransferase